MTLNTWRGLPEEEQTVTTQLYVSMLPKWMRSSSLACWALRAQKKHTRGKEVETCSGKRVALPEAVETRGPPADPKALGLFSAVYGMQIARIERTAIKMSVTSDVFIAVYMVHGSSAHKKNKNNEVQPSTLIHKSSDLVGMSP